MILEEQIKVDIFQVLKHNDFDVEKIKEFNKVEKTKNHYTCSIACSTSDKDNDLICHFSVQIHEGDEVEISNIQVF